MNDKMDNLILPNISLEQQNIINLLKQQNNVIVESVAGSGKTTSNLFVAKSFPESNILLLTYNAKLKIETRDKIASLKINNIETHSYHSFCVKYYNNKAYTDTEILSIIKNKRYERCISFRSSSSRRHNVSFRQCIRSHCNYPSNSSNLKDSITWTSHFKC